MSNDYNNLELNWRKLESIWVIIAHELMSWTVITLKGWHALAVIPCSLHSSCRGTCGRAVKVPSTQPLTAWVRVQVGTKTFMWEGFPAGLQCWWISTNKSWKSPLTIYKQIIPGACLLPLVLSQTWQLHIYCLFNEINKGV